MMRRVVGVSGCLIGLLVFGAWVNAPNRRADAQQPGRVVNEPEHTLQGEPGERPQKELIALSVLLEGGIQQVTVIDPESRHMSVYHIDPESGAIALKSARSITADLRIDDFNGGNPTPREIRALLEQQ